MTEAAIRQLLVGDDDVKALADERVYFNIAPQDERRPRIVLTLLSLAPDFTFDNRSNWGSGSMQIACLAPTYPEAKQLVAAAREVLEAFEGTQDGTEFGWIQTENMRDIPAAPLTGRAVPTFGVSIDARFLVME